MVCFQSIRLFVEITNFFFDFFSSKNVGGSGSKNTFAHSPVWETAALALSGSVRRGLVRLGERHPLLGATTFSLSPFDIMTLGVKMKNAALSIIKALRKTTLCITPLSITTKNLTLSMTTFSITTLNTDIKCSITIEKYHT
jgi:hypothetical protein